jgi:hypothetical protein
MKQIFWNRAEDARNLGSVAVVCLAVVIWIGARACFAIFEEAIFYSLQEWFLSRNQRRQPRQAKFNRRVLAKQEDIATTPLFAEFLKVREAHSRCIGDEDRQPRGKNLRPIKIKNTIRNRGTIF